MITAIAVILFVLVSDADAKLKGLPIKSYKDYSLKDLNVQSLKYTVYAPKQEGETVVKGEVADFIAEIFFDDKGNRVREIVYNIESGKVDVVTNWKYNSDKETGTVIETRSTLEGELLARTEYLVNYKSNTVLVRRYENIFDPLTQLLLTNVLVFEELWTEDAKHDKVIYKKTFFDFRDGVAMKQTISEEELKKPYTLYLILENLTAPIDYTWLYNYNEKALKASSSKTRKESIFDGTRYEYKTKKKLLDRVLYFGEDKKLKNETAFVYSLDERKNWTKVIQKENNNPRFIVEREIKYRF
jgi:hypothetical protein